ncbi:MAG: hypothetical protein ABI120_15785, partial [Gemmatimonadaceae bacterium]
MSRRALKLVVAAIALAAAGCSASTQMGRSDGVRDCCQEDAHRIEDRFKVAALTSRRFMHTELWSALDPVLKPGTLKVTKFGESLQGRALNAITVGNGPTTVL